MLPSFKVPEGYDTESYFRHVAREGLETRFKEFDATGKRVNQDAYRARLAMELDVIATMKFPGYFLIVWDFIRYAKENGVPVARPRLGRRIDRRVRDAHHRLDPIPYNLLFERFLKPERVSMPDFDIDFCMTGVTRSSRTSRRSTASRASARSRPSPSSRQERPQGRRRCIGISPVDAQILANLIPRKNPAETYTLAESLSIEPKLRPVTTPSRSRGSCSTRRRSSKG